VVRIFDDRGFVSSVLMHDESGVPATQYYLSRSGDVIFSEDVPTGRIDVIAETAPQFRQTSYARLEDLIAEVLGGYLAEPGPVPGRTTNHAPGLAPRPEPPRPEPPRPEPPRPEPPRPEPRSAADTAPDTVVLALAPQHDELIVPLLTNQTLVISQGDAPPPSPVVLDRATIAFTGLAARSEPAATDTATRNTAAPDAATPDLAPPPLPTVTIYPLEERATFGASANEADVNITVYVDNLAAVDLDYLIAILSSELVDNDHNIR
jgi:hypothetical protein